MLEHWIVFWKAVVPKIIKSHLTLPYWIGRITCTMVFRYLVQTVLASTTDGCSSFADWTSWSWPLAGSAEARPSNILWYTSLILGIDFLFCICHIHLAAIPRLHHILLKLAEVQSLAGCTEPVRFGRTCQG